MARKLPIILQAERAECGIACLAMIAAFHGDQQGIASLRRKFSGNSRGAELAQLVHLAKRLDLQTRALRIEPEQLKQLATPALLHWNLNHFVVLAKVTSKGVVIHDPSCGQRLVSHTELDQSFTGVALELTPTPDFKPKAKPKNAVSKAWMLPSDGVVRTISQVLLLAIALELLTLAAPWGMQFLLDSVLISHSSSDLLLVCAMLGASIVFQGLLHTTRAWILADATSQLNAQWTTQLFHHLLKLPIVFFENRPAGQIIQRFSSLQFIERILSNSFIDAILDGLSSALILLVLWLYSPAMALVVIATSLLYGLTRMAILRWSARLESERLVYNAQLMSQSIEAIRAVATVKLAGTEAFWGGRIANLSGEIAARNALLQRCSAIAAALSKTLFGAQRLALLSMGSWLALGANFSAGKLVAFVAFADMFATRAATFIDRLADLKMLDVHFQNVSEIAAEAAEPTQEGAHALDLQPDRTLSAPCIEANNIGFRYSEQSPWIFRNLSFSIAQGESIALVGASGCGKTTLAKILLGLYQLTEGSLRIAGRDVQHIALAERRALFASVLQDDALFSGSIADNIADFAPDAKLNDIIHAAQLAHIHDTINAMPMGYESLVGDVGAGLSGGQKQRVLLARALYRKAAILLLDEATSHLDVDCERAVNRNVAALRQTRILIAHRPETIASADRCITLGDSELNVTSLLTNQKTLPAQAHKVAMSSAGSAELVLARSKPAQTEFDALASQSAV